MIKFKDILLESHGVNIETNKDIINIFKKNCKSYPKVKIDLFRGVESHSLGILDTIVDYRESVDNALSFINCIIDNTWPIEYPRRSKSIMMTTSENVASLFGKVYQAIPFDNARLAISSNNDFMYTLVSIGGLLINLNKLNYHIHRIVRGDEYKPMENLDESPSFENIKQKLSEPAKKVAPIYYKTSLSENYKLNFSFEELVKVLSPKNLKVRLGTYKPGFSIANKDCEVWTNSSVLLIGKLSDLYKNIK